MERYVRLGLAQINCIVGDLDGNAEKIISYIDKGRQAGVDIIAFPELAVTGYPPEDLLMRPRFIEDNIRVLKGIAKACADITAVIGFADADADTLSIERGSGEKNIYNAAAVICNGKIGLAYHKMLLPNYGVFDERRYFTAGTEHVTFDLGGVVFGVNICEDIWHAEGPSGIRPIAGNAEVIININASPFHAGKQEERKGILARRIAESGVTIAYTNLVGGQDELVFDGGSMIMDHNGSIVADAPHFEEALLVADLKVGQKKGPDAGKAACLIVGELKEKTKLMAGEVLPPLSLHEEVYGALVLGTRDYVIKSGFEKVIIGLSGGIDSALTAALAVDALGAENVMGVAMPSRYSSKGSIDDAKGLAENLKIEFKIISIEKPFDAFADILSDTFRGLGEDVTEENLQARIRGNILMALSNKFGRMVLTTGNKSEMSVGYSTLYGDMAGGFGVLKDVPKMLVYALARFRNERAGFDLIPESTLTKPPSAELRPGQTDQDSLPPYDKLDAILQKYIEEERSTKEIVAAGFDPSVVAAVTRMVDDNEYKRRQAAPGVKITPRAFGRDRRMPIVNRYRGGRGEGK